MIRSVEDDRSPFGRAHHNNYLLRILISKININEGGGASQTSLAIVTISRPYSPDSDRPNYSRKSCSYSPANVPLDRVAIYGTI